MRGRSTTTLVLPSVAHLQRLCPRHTTDVLFGFFLILVRVHHAETDHKPSIFRLHDFFATQSWSAGIGQKDNLARPDLFWPIWNSLSPTFLTSQWQHKINRDTQKKNCAKSITTENKLEHWVQTGCSYFVFFPSVWMFCLPWKVKDWAFEMDKMRNIDSTFPCLWIFWRKFKFRSFNSSEQTEKLDHFPAIQTKQPSIRGEQSNILWYLTSQTLSNKVKLPRKAEMWIVCPIWFPFCWDSF